jgi:hypothetical protein
MAERAPPAMAGAAVAARPERGHHRHHAGVGARRCQRPLLGPRRASHERRPRRGGCGDLAGHVARPTRAGAGRAVPPRRRPGGGRRRWPVARHAGRRRGRRCPPPPPGAGPRPRPGRGRPAPGDRRALAGRSGRGGARGRVRHRGRPPTGRHHHDRRTAGAGTWRGVDRRHRPLPDRSAGPGVDQPGHRRPARHGPRPGRVCARSAAGGPRPGRVVRRRSPAGRRHLAGGEERSRGGHPGPGRRLRRPGHLPRRAHHRHRRDPGRGADGRSDPSGRHAQSRRGHARPGHLRPARRVPRRRLPSHRGRAGRRHPVDTAIGPRHRRAVRVRRPEPTPHMATRRDRLRRRRRRRGRGHGVARAARRAAQHPAVARQQRPATPPARPADAGDHRATAARAGVAGAARGQPPPRPLPRQHLVGSQAASPC